MASFVRHLAAEVQRRDEEAAVERSGSAVRAVARSHVAGDFLAAPAPRSHAVQFYEEDAFLLDSVTRYLGAGLERRELLLIIATEGHRAALLPRLEAFGANEAIRDGRVMFLDARNALSIVTDGNELNPIRFQQMIAERISDLRRGSEGGRTNARVRVYSEIVDLLLKDGRLPSALRVEELWSQVKQQHELELLCAHTTTHFREEEDIGAFLDICRVHSHVIPREEFARIESKHDRWLAISILQQRARAYEREAEERRKLEEALRCAMEERIRAEEELTACLEREREARVLSEASEAFKEVFLSKLGHDLRNPLNSILVTARLMLLRREVAEASLARLERIVSGGERMERMIAQILDVARARHPDGMPIAVADERDLSPVVARIVEEARSSNPSLTIELTSTGGCTARVDPARFEQVVSTLVGNAVGHGDPDRPIRVAIAALPDAIRVSVHNYGEPIDKEHVQVLLDPFHSAFPPRCGSKGLGVGLYVAERIMAAHGGVLDVESSKQAGTRFDAIFPRRR
ncbi:MAG: hypothetical protein HOW73_49715 [Polyangiaceae bacterium]|nr:hypothetical protein [Polyangiaceae bacterium]